MCVILPTSVACFGIKLLSHGSSSGRSSRNAVVRWTVVVDAWGCWRCEESVDIVLGQPLLTRYSSQEWSMVWVIEVARARG